MLYVLVGVLVIRLQMSIKTHQPVHLKLVHFVIHNLCLSEGAILEKPSVASHYTQNLSSAGVLICPQLSPYFPCRPTLVLPLAPVHDTATLCFTEL